MGTSGAHGKGGVSGVTVRARSRSAVVSRWMIAAAILLTAAIGLATAATTGLFGPGKESA